MRFPHRHGDDPGLISDHAWLDAKPGPEAHRREDKPAMRWQALKTRGFRHGRPCAGHPTSGRASQVRVYRAYGRREAVEVLRSTGRLTAWMPGTRPGMTLNASCGPLILILATYGMEARGPRVLAHMHFAPTQVRGGLAGPNLHMPGYSTVRPRSLARHGLVQAVYIR
jgi:hypothetical protein